MIKLFMITFSKNYYSLSMDHQITQIDIINTCIHVEINMNNDTQKERMFILSFGGVEDVLIGKSSCFYLLEIQLFLSSRSPWIDLWMYNRGLILVAPTLQGSILDSWRIDTYFYRPRKYANNSFSFVRKNSKSQCWPRNNSFSLQKASLNSYHTFQSVFYLETL